MTPFSPYQKRLFVLLSFATFFEGYDFIALSQILPTLRVEFGLSEGGGGFLASVIGLGTVFSYLLVRLADRWGRRRVLLLTIAGYAWGTLFSTLASTEYDFAVFQFLTRMFQIAQWAVGMIYAAEEYPADRRAFVLGVIQAMNAVGAIACAGAVPFLLGSPLGWRGVYFVGVLPLLVLPVARRFLRETERFADQKAPTAPHSLFAIFSTPYSRRVLQLALIWGLTYVSTSTALLFWKEFAVAERGFSDAEVGKAVVIASLLAAPFVFSVGRLIDHWGRRRSSALIYAAAAVFVLLAYHLRSFWALTVCLGAAMVAGIGLLTLLNALTTELFPTGMRADAFAWSNNLLGRIGYVLAPGFVGWAAAHFGWSLAVSFTALSVLGALALILWLIPETGGKELEEAARLEA